MGRSRRRRLKERRVSRTVGGVEGGAAAVPWFLEIVAKNENLMIMLIPNQMAWIGAHMIQKNVMNIMIERDSLHHHNLVVVGRTIEIEITPTTMRKNNIILEMVMNIRIIAEGGTRVMGVGVYIVTVVDTWVLCMMIVDIVVKTVVVAGMIAIDRVDHLEISTMMMMAMSMMIIPKMGTRMGSRMIMTKIAGEEVMVTMIAITRNVLTMTLQAGMPK
mmetsp:Transcript_5479/g.9146  ORF Transcript_5479/g.9146 Transcript_5479/m.9146 type:complete len:217 (+) Transcript_5479:952-1602(+)